jgi:hypothetical protein
MQRDKKQILSGKLSFQKDFLEKYAEEEFVTAILALVFSRQLSTRLIGIHIAKS